MRRQVTEFGKIMKRQVIEFDKIMNRQVTAEVINKMNGSPI